MAVGNQMNKEQKTIIQIYAAFAASIVMNFVPSSGVQIFGSLLLLVVFIAMYVYKARSKEDSLIFNHMTFLIITIWVAGLLLALGIAGAVAFADHSLVENMMNDIRQGFVPTEQQIKILMIDYLNVNLIVFSATLGPSLIYMVYRIAQGAERATKGYRISKPKRWF